MKQLIFIICLFGSINSAIAQKTDSLKFNNRKFKHEIGIDFRGIFNNNYYYLANSANHFYDGLDRGYSFIWKVRNDRGKLISVSYIKNWRFQFRTSSITNTDRVQRFESNGTTFEYKENGISSLYVQPSFGFERVNFFDRFNFYYGADFGFLVYRVRGATNYGFEVNGNYFSFTTNSMSYGPDATGFVGMKYRFSERFSIAVETGFGIYFHLVRSKLYDNQAEKIVSKTAYENFGHSFYPLRLLTFNYHFKQF